MTEFYKPYPSFRYITLLFLSVLLWGNQLYAQDINQKLNINIKDATLEEFIKTIEKSTTYSFIYSEKIKVTKKISLNVQNKTIEEILQLVFQGEAVTYKISGKHILLQKSVSQEVRKFTVSGYVTDQTSSETLIGVNILDKLRFRGTSTNPYGYYTITLPEGDTELHFSYLGYNTRQFSFKLNKDTLLNIQMNTDNELEEVVILSDKVEAGINAIHTGAIDIPMTQIKNTPVILGESDVMKTIQSMPGVQAGVDGSAGLYVRGGSPDQNLILLDGVPIYNVDHLLGFFSVFTPEAIKKVTLFKSSFPARFGGRLSSVIDVRTNDGDMNKYHGSLSIGLLTSRFNLEGPIVKDKTSFNISLRRTYFDLVSRPFMNEDVDVGYYFYDINAKVNHKFSDKDRLFFSFYHGNDYLVSDFSDEWGSDTNLTYSKDKGTARWGNLVAALRWNHIINNKLFSNTTLAFNRYHLNIDTKSTTKYKNNQATYHTKYDSGIHDLSLQTDFDYTPSPKHHIKFGGGYLFHNFKPETINTKISLVEDGLKEDTLFRANSNSQLYAHELSLYAEDNINLSPKLRTNIGLHASAFFVQGKAYFSLQPRFAARYQIKKNVALKASYSKMNQYINLLTSAPISMPTDLWVPVTKKIKPMNAHQYSIGAYYTGIPGWEFSAETYYKNMNNVLEYKDGSIVMGNSSSWETKVEMGKGRSYGIEFMIQRTVGKTTGWLSYTLAKSDRKFAKNGINNGKRFPFKYDRRHNIDLMLNHKFSNKIDVGVSWTFMSGATATLAQEVIAVPRPDGPATINYWINPTNDLHFEDYIESRNNYRLPPTHRLNVGVNFHKKTKRGFRTINVSVYNVYNAMNPNFVNKAGYFDGETGEYEQVITKLTILPFFPSITYTYKF
ncbi:TonB-dependent receptor [Bacteroides sp. 519]|uniref:TonB-dependent receptor n=1 Tax=Bacteroides sp. 519 TaxID=2302937 RepID=UPI0013CFB433|nr:TonB-dependent receptor [Bacteroides sp. 519]NDV57205.1 TonB-dependent receptor [Bacteroides sp. 519]